MSPAARSMKLFGFYLCALGIGLIAAPALLMAPFGVPAPTEIWARVCGLLALLIGVYYQVVAQHEFVPMMRASVWGRAAVLPVFAVFVLVWSAPPALLLFGVVDAAAAIWTAKALRGSGTPVQAR